jgi:hypothetical protein
MKRFKQSQKTKNSNCKRKRIFKNRKRRKRMNQRGYHKTDYKTRRQIKQEKKR